MNKKGQLKLSFGMIFSIFLIIIFVTFAFFAIKKFLGIQKGVQLGKFIDDLQTDVDKLWRGTQGSQKVTYYLPNKVQSVCFTNYAASARGPKQSLYNTLKQVYYEFENMFFYPLGSGEGTDAVVVKHLNMEKITEKENPLCFDVEKGKITMTVEKKYGEASVTLKK